jgi:hypothetical protein
MAEEKTAEQLIQEGVIEKAETFDRALTPEEIKAKADEGAPEENKLTPEEERRLDPKRITDYKAFCIRFDGITESMKFSVKEHPRAIAHMDRLNEMLKELLSDYIFDEILPIDNTPTKEERENALAIGAHPKQRKRLEE